MTAEENGIVSDLHLRLEQAEQLLRSLIDADVDDGELRAALECVHVATINFNSFVSDLN